MDTPFIIGAVYVAGRIGMETAQLMLYDIVAQAQTHHLVLKQNPEVIVEGRIANVVLQLPVEGVDVLVNKSPRNSSFFESNEFLVDNPYDFIISLLAYRLIVFISHFFLFSIVSLLRISKIS